jgi:protein tyrosine phosphatase (PTP) superfamily phosphohydrolase (DUF442 family)
MTHWTWLLLLPALAAGWPQDHASPGEASGPAPARVTAPGLPNVWRLSPTLYSGGSPEGDEGFRSLRALGVRTIITVDGARPEVERARKFGLRYVHLPTGYDGVPRDQALRIARAVRDLPGPVYIHCHHGLHRGPAAAAAARLCVDPKCTVAEALEGMRRAGTDPHYRGLFESVSTLRRPTAGELERVPADFPETTRVLALTQVMVEIDDRWEHLKQVRAAGWKTPPDHPDLDPPHEALLLREQYREAARLPQSRQRSEDFRRRLDNAEGRARELEEVLRRGKEQGPADRAAAERAFNRAAAACAGCHARYRDVPQRR